MVKTIKLYLKVIVLIQMISLFFQSIKKKKKNDYQGFMVIAYTQSTLQDGLIG